MDEKLKAKILKEIVPTTKGKGAKGKFTVKADTLTLIKEQIRANKGAFKLPVKTAIEMLGYTGGAKVNSVVSTLNQNIFKGKGIRVGREGEDWIKFYEPEAK